MLKQALRFAPLAADAYTAYRARRAYRRPPLGQRIGLLVLAVLAGLAGLLLLQLAGYFALTALVAPVYAALIMAGAYLLIAGVAVLLAQRKRKAVVIAPSPISPGYGRALSPYVDTARTRIAARPTASLIGALALGAVLGAWLDRR